MSDLLNQASLVMIPSGYAEDKVYSVVPSDGSGDLSFTRASNGTRINSAGLVEVVAWNLVEYSEQIDNAAWTKQDATVSANSSTAPNGTTTADKLIPNTTLNFHPLIQNINVQNGANYTFSVYAKAAGYDYILCNTGNGSSSGNCGPIVNLTNGAIVGSLNGNTYNAQVENVGNGWYKIVFSFLTNDTSTNVDINILPTSTIAAYSGNGTNGVLIWGYQLNIGSTAKPYFPTTDRLNVPRLTYQNGGGGCPSLLLEKQSTNQLTYSEQFDNSDWTKTGVTISANNTTSPDGTQNADKLVSINGATSCGILQYSLLSTSINYTYSTYVKKGGADWVQLIIITGVVARVWVNLTNGAIGTNNGNFSSVKVDAMGDGWYRVSAVFASTIIGTSIYIALADGDNIDAFTGNGTSGLFAWGAQLEPSSYVTSYIPTTSSSATRVADDCFKTGISSLIGQTEGVIFAETIYNGSADTGEFNRIINITDGTSSNFMSLSKNNTTDELYIYCQTSAGVQVNSGAISGTSLIGRHKIALAYKSNDFVLYVDGVQKFVDTSAAVPTCSRLNIGDLQNLFSSTDQFGGSVSQAVIFPTRLTNAELASLTTI